jgi:primosomal protein N' (replication factor Y) (superfamily II helicase)
LASRIARILPDVSGLDRSFDYSIPEHLAHRVAIGTLVRIDLHNRRVGGWVVALDDHPAVGVDVDRLKPIVKVTGAGPSAEIIELAQWASVRWAARRIRPFLVTASPRRAVTSVGLPRRSASVTAGPTSPATDSVLAAGGGVLRLPPRADVVASILSAVSFACGRGGSVLVVVPSAPQVALLAIRLRRGGLTVAVHPDQWAAGADGVDVVLGARAVSWAPCADLAAAVVVDEHDEALQEERSPTWHARDVVVERCRRAGVPCVIVSPIPTLTAVETCTGSLGVVHPPANREHAGWPVVTVVDRTDEDPWKRSLVTPELIDRLRTPGLRIVCVSNITGRARVLACRNCRALIRCEGCDAAVGLDDAGRLACRRCGTERPPVCQECGRSSFANLRPGVTRLREELEAAANRPVVAVTGSSDETVPAEIHVGTEAVLHRVATADVVAFLEFDSEMLAPRFRSAEHALALIVRAGRVAPEVLIQTFTPDHEVIRAARHGDPSIVTDGERARRQALHLPPYAALARVSGEGADVFAARLNGQGIEIGGGDGHYLVRANDWTSLGERLNATERPTGSRIRIEVDPARV